MNTTSLFVELVVIGAGAALAIFVLILVLFGTGWVVEGEVLEESFGLPLLFVLVPVVYVLGIVTDRIADQVFDAFGAGGRWKLHYVDKSDYFRARRYLLHESEPFSEELAYERSRLRICRGWAVDALLLLVAWLLLWDWRGEELGLTPGTGLGVALFFAVVLGASVWSWNSLNQAQVKKIRRKVDWLYERAEPPISVPRRPSEEQKRDHRRESRRELVRGSVVLALVIVGLVVANLLVSAALAP